MNTETITDTTGTYTARTVQIQTADMDTPETMLLVGATAAGTPAGALAWEGHFIPVELIQGDGPDRLATPGDWETDSCRTVAEALESAADTEYWYTSGQLSNDAKLLDY